MMRAAFCHGRQVLVRCLGEASQVDRSQRGKASIVLVHDMPSGVIPGTMRWGSSVGGALANIDRWRTGPRADSR